MTVEHVIERVKQQNSLVNSLEQDEKIIILNALEKQIPKKPLKGGVMGFDGEERACSPNCGLDNFEFGFNVCVDCGQHIDWSE